MSRFPAHLTLLVLLAACASDSEAPLGPSLGKKPPAPPPDPAIAWSDDGLYVMNEDGSNQLRLVPGGWVGNPTWAPYEPGATRFRIAYSDIDLGEVRVVAVTTSGGVLRGGGSTLLVTGAAEPAWSPLGDEIAYTASTDQGIGVWITDTTGSVRTLIPQTVLPGGVMRPAWKGDGLALAFWQDRDATSDRPDVKKIQIITRATRQDPWSQPREVYADPDPSAGNALDWARTRNVLAFTAGYAGAPILTLSLGSQLDSIAASPDTVGRGARPSWSPDDRYLVYLYSGLRKLDLATGTNTLLTRRTGCCRPSWRRAPVAPR